MVLWDNENYSVFFCFFNDIVQQWFRTRVLPGRGVFRGLPHRVRTQVYTLYDY